MGRLPQDSDKNDLKSKSKFHVMTFLNIGPCIKESLRRK